MIQFIGEYSTKLDDKGRLVFPAPFRGAFGQGEKIALVAKLSLFDSCIDIYTMEQWNETSAALHSRLNMYNREHAAFWREYMRGVAVLEPSAGLSRITIPSNMLKRVGVDAGSKDVLFVGVNDKIQVWSKSRYENSAMAEEEYVALAEKILG